VSDDLASVVGAAVPRETARKIDRFVELLKAESLRQNLVAKSTIDTLWERHVVDSAQLVRFEPMSGASWVDIGSGAGLPGIVIACLVKGAVTLVEPRRLRAGFLEHVSMELELGARIVCAKAQNVEGTFDVVTARAVASVDDLVRMTIHLSHLRTVWVLPKGRKAKSELEEARRSWHCDASSAGSLTDPESEVLVLRNVRPKGRG
jgi:16S rRNA (guanine527-N7)-methyltransferase